MRSNRYLERATCRPSASAARAKSVMSPNPAESEAAEWPIRPLLLEIISAEPPNFGRDQRADLSTAAFVVSSAAMFNRTVSHWLVLPKPA